MVDLRDKGGGDFRLTDKGCTLQDEMYQDTFPFRWRCLNTQRIMKMSIPPLRHGLCVGIRGAFTSQYAYQFP